MKCVCFRASVMCNTSVCPVGGRDTAGLGGKGGPYRLDAGHKVHQLSKAEIDAIPEDVRKAAREMGEKAFKARCVCACARVGGCR